MNPLIPRSPKSDREALYLATDIESLERRQMLAGNVTATITGAGNLVINGDGADNNILVDIDSSGNVTVTGNDGETIDDSGLIGSQVSGDVKINVKGGNDTVYLNGTADLPIDDVTLIGGGGDDTLVAANLYGSTDNVKIAGGSGQNYMTVKYAEASGDITMTGGGDSDYAYVAYSQADDIKVNTGGGDDSVLVYGAFSYGKLAISVSSGDNNVQTVASVSEGNCRSNRAGAKIRLPSMIQAPSMAATWISERAVAMTKSGD